MQLANNTEYGLAASVWSESVNLALDIAPKLKAGVVWVNSTNLFDAVLRLRRLQGERLRPRGRARGRLRLYQAGVAARRSRIAEPSRRRAEIGAAPSLPGLIDRTAKLYIGGKQPRPDGGYSRPVPAPRRQARRRGRRGQPQGHPERGRGGAEGGRLGIGQRAQPRADPLLHRRESLRPRRRVRRAARGPHRRAPRQGAGRGRRRRSRGSSPSPPGPTSTRAPSTGRRSAAWRLP